MLAIVSAATKKIRSWLGKLARLFGFSLFDSQRAEEEQKPTVATSTTAADIYVIHVDAEDVTDDTDSSGEVSANDTDYSDEMSAEETAACTPVAKPSEPKEKVDPALWTALQQVTNCAAAWQIRLHLPLDVAALDGEQLARKTSKKVCKRVKKYPVLTVLRGTKASIRSTPLSWLSEEAFAKMKEIERRAVHHVLSSAKWSKQHQDLYAAREQELVKEATENGGSWAEIEFYPVPLHDHRAYSTYARDSEGWEDPAAHI
ncbi:hypothetical protein PHYBOEH_004292 [Phytophthora boehmeriae]|uniref:Uncharacterized protein n=1 Tax=Phytophthora boehmeriae TaxID=109152 RepID=A0A8T1X8Z1_9STRA|nr:hypothetical protein PHYBOEH_004292 [Phytophthora boehmeriae]